MYDLGIPWYTCLWAITVKYEISNARWAAGGANKAILRGRQTSKCLIQSSSGCGNRGMLLRLQSRFTHLDSHGAPHRARAMSAFFVAVRIALGCCLEWDQFKVKIMQIQLLSLCYMMSRAWTKEWTNSERNHHTIF